MSFRQGVSQNFTEEETAMVVSQVLFAFSYIHTECNIMMRRFTPFSIGLVKPNSLEMIKLYNFQSGHICDETDYNHL